MTIAEVLNHDNEFLYMLLDRMRSDCGYFLGNGHRLVKHLWAGSVAEQISYMKAIWNHFPEDGKPEWLTVEEINDLDKKMEVVA